MTAALVRWIVAGNLLTAAPAVAQSMPEAAARVEGRVAAVRVHGNHTTPDEEVLAIAAVGTGDPVTHDLIENVSRRLERSGRFRSVDVRPRYASLSDPSAILLVIVVEERIGISLDVPAPGAVRRLKASTMWLPVLRYDDGYGFTYGARLALVEAVGRKTRIGVPLTWGGERRAGVEVERRFDSGPLTRVLAEAGITRSEHPALEIGDCRTAVVLRAEQALAASLVAGATVGVSSIRFGAARDTLRTAGVHVVWDTRHDPAFPRDALYVSAGVERLWFDQHPETTRLAVDARGFVGLLGSNVLALRALHSRTGSAVPVYEQALLGAETLRGFPLGFRYGDRLAALSMEYRIPFTSPLRAGRFGAAVFVDTGSVYSGGESLDSALFDTGIGGGLFMQAPLVSFRADVARGLGGSTRAHVSLGVRF